MYENTERVFKNNIAHKSKNIIINMQGTNNYVFNFCFSYM